METIIVAALVGLISSFMIASIGGYFAWRLISTKLIEPKVVFEEPAKKKHILVAGDGVYTLHEKRKCKVIDEQKEWVREQNERDRNNY